MFKPSGRDIAGRGIGQIGSGVEICLSCHRDVTVHFNIWCTLEERERAGELGYKEGCFFLKRQMFSHIKNEALLDV